jgi:uncharacterized protein
MSLSRRRFLQISAASALVTTVAGVGGFAYAHDVEPGWFDIVPQSVTLPRLGPAFAGYRIAQISDIHMGTGMTIARLQQVAALVNAQQPDLIAITGDFVTRGSVAAAAPALMDGLSQLEAPDGVVCVMGNHDHWTNVTEVRAIVQASGIHDISNQFITLERGADQLHIAGVDSLWEHLDRLDLVLADLPEAGAAVLLAHEPDFADISAPTGRFGLQMSGHSHGGQVILPVLGPPLIPRHARQYPVGRYQVGDMVQYTNRGVGTVMPAVRLNCRPEITVFTLKTTAA